MALFQTHANYIQSIDISFIISVKQHVNIFTSFVVEVPCFQLGFKIFQRDIPLLFSLIYWFKARTGPSWMICSRISTGLYSGYHAFKLLNGPTHYWNMKLWSTASVSQIHLQVDGNWFWDIQFCFWKWQGEWRGFEEHHHIAVEEGNNLI